MKFALHQIDNKREWIDELLKTESIDSLRAASKKGIFLCPYCFVPMGIRGGKKNADENLGTCV